MVDRPTSDRQRKLDEVVRAALASFVGRELTPYLVAEAEGAMRSALDRAIMAGTYILPDGLLLDYVTVGEDMRIKVFFKKRRDRLIAVVEETFDGPDRGS